MNRTSLAHAQLGAGDGRDTIVRGNGDGGSQAHIQ